MDVDVDKITVKLLLDAFDSKDIVLTVVINPALLLTIEPEDGEGLALESDCTKGATSPPHTFWFGFGAPTDHFR